VDLLFRRRADAADELRDRQCQAPVVAYSTVAILTATTYTFGGLMREQVCIYMCPWPRIQAAMLDEDSLVVTYNDWRGEPRSRHAKKAAAAGQVRSAIASTAMPASRFARWASTSATASSSNASPARLCIDACDNIMDKLGKPRGLISYATLRDYNHNMALAQDPETGASIPRACDTADGGFVDAVKHFNWRIVFRLRGRSSTWAHGRDRNRSPGGAAVARPARGQCAA
jgi:polyferredoxin